ncbi:MAG: glycosyltransferase [Prevotella sp.]|nr:glycosyltransferase [Prevotella sp.]
MKEDKNNICLITNIGTHYRLPIFTKMAEEFSCSFFLGDKLDTEIKTFEYSNLPGFKKELTNIFFHNFYWQSGSVKLIFLPYKYYILDGEPYCLSSWIILLLAKLCGKETIAWTHGWYGRESVIKKVIKKVFYKLHSRLLIYSDYAIRLMEDVGIPSEKMFCIANSLDSYKEKGIRDTLQVTDIYQQHFHNESPTIIYCGRIQKRKKLEILIDCIEQLKAEGHRVNVIMVGEDVDNVNIEAYAEEHRVGGQVWMYGPCYDDNILAELFYNASVCVSPGNVGLTAIHSLSFGCPVITHGDFPYQMPEFEAIKPGVTGDFYERGSITDLKNKIKKWITISAPEREKTRMEAFKEIDTKWNIDYQINILKKVLSE